MRRQPTHAEKVLWKAIRGLDGFHFRRQVAFGPFVADFASHRFRLIVELDGGVHEVERVIQRDEKREAWLKARGYQIVRIDNDTAIRETGTAIAAILATSRQHPIPQPLPARGRGVSESPST